MSKLTGKVALVTGASKGIGAGIAKELAANGAAVAVNYSSSKAEAEKIVAEIKAAGGKAIAVHGSVANPDAIGPLVATVAKELGPITTLVNNAGVYDISPIEGVTPDHFHKQFNINVLGLLLITQEVLKHFAPAGGSIINISSIAAIGMANASVYSATKGAVNAITGSLAQELGARKIRVNAISPGLVETEGSDAGLNSEFKELIVAQTPLGRAGRPDDIAALAVFLASDDARWLTGEKLLATGGLR